MAYRAARARRRLPQDSEATQTLGLSANHLFDPTGALRRIPLPPAPGRAAQYAEVWDEAAGAVESAFAMVDGSKDEEVLRASGERMAQALVRALGITNEHRVLEVGCGVARIGREIAPFCGEWHGVDISPNMIAIAAARTADRDNVHLQALSSNDLAIYPDATFDRVYSHIVLFHLDKEDMFGYIAEFQRVLKPGGLVYFDTWNLAHPFGWQRFVHERELNRRVFPRRANRNRFATPQEVRIYTEGLGLGVLALLEDSSVVQVVAVRPRESESRATAAARARNTLTDLDIEKIRPKSVPQHSPPSAERALFVVDSPVSGTSLTGEVEFYGWALHPEEIDDPAWGEVAVFCITLLLQSSDELPQEIGYAQHNLPRPDVAAAYSEPRYLYCGWLCKFDSRSVPNGEYTLWVEAHLTCGYRHVSLPVRVEN